MFKLKRKKIRNVERPEHPGKAIYTAILGAKMSVGEVATVLGITRPGLVKVLRGENKLTARMAFLLAEVFGWDRATRWHIMQAKLDMYKAGVDEKRARKSLFEEDLKDLDGSKWEEEMEKAWREEETGDHFEELHNPKVRVDDDQIEHNLKTLKEEVDDAST
jgi:addiction module HigA family antidote